MISRTELSLAVTLALSILIGHSPAEARSPELKRLDSELHRLTGMISPDASVPIPKNAASLAKRLAPTVEKMILTDLESGSRQSAPWVGGDGPINAIRTVFESAGNERQAVRWRDLWLLSGAKFDYLDGDIFSAGWFFGALTEAKYRAPDVYEKALALMGVTRKDYCTDGFPLEVCVLRTGGDVMRSLTAVAAGLDLEQDALRRVEAAPNLAPDKVVSYQTRVALVEWTVGSLALATSVIERAGTIARRHRQKLTASSLYRFHVLAAVISDARLKDSAVASHFTKALALLASAGVEAKQDRTATQTTLSRANAAATSELLDLVYRLIVVGECRACTPGLQSALAAFLQTQAGSPLAYLIARAAPKGIVDATTIKLLRDGIVQQQATNRFISFGAAQNELESWIRKAVKTVKTRQIYDVIALSLFADFNPVLGAQSAGPRFIMSRGLREAKKYEQASLGETKSNNYLQFGADLAYLKFASKFAGLLGRLGFRSAQHLVLQDLVTELRETFRTDAETAGLADLAAPAFVDLARVKPHKGRDKSAGNLLRDALRSVEARLEREWRISNQNAAASVRRLLPTIKQATAIQVALARAGSRRDVDAALAWMQLASTGDTAIAGQTTIRKRLSERSGAADILAKREAVGLNLQRLVAMKDNLSALFRPGGIDTAIALAKKDLTTLDAQLKSQNADWAQNFSITAVTSGNITQALRPGEAMVLLHSGRDKVFGAVIPAKGKAVVWSVSVSQKELSDLVASVRRGVDLSEGSFPAFPTRQASKLWFRLFGPVSDRIRAQKQLIFSVDGPLQSLPFGILLTKRPSDDVVQLENINKVGLQWLARTHAISVVPSASMFVRQRKSDRPSNARLAFLGIGDPVLAPSDGASRRVDFGKLFGARALADNTILRKLASLPETADELRKIAEVLGAENSKLILGAQATESELKRMNLTDYRVLAFATHGLVAGVLSGHAEPGLVLTPPEKPTTADDGLLSMSEIMALKLDSDLVILSACDTATSDGRPRADGLSGLARAFFAAGARSLVVTHWSIPSEPAVQVTTGLVKARAAASSTTWAEALRKSVNVLIDSADPSLAHPASWGAFQIVGTN